MSPTGTSLLIVVFISQNAAAYSSGQRLRQVTISYAAARPSTAALTAATWPASTGSRRTSWSSRCTVEKPIVVGEGVGSRRVGRDAGRQADLAADARAPVGPAPPVRLLPQRPADAPAPVVGQHVDLQVGQVLVVPHRSSEVGDADGAAVVDRGQERVAVVGTRGLGDGLERRPGADHRLRSVMADRGLLGVVERAQAHLVPGVELDDLDHADTQPEPGPARQTSYRGRLVRWPRHTFGPGLWPDRTSTPP